PTRSPPMATPRRPRSAALALALAVAGAATPAAAAPQRLGLREAIELSLRTDPGLLGAMATERRGENAVLRAQLDRFSLKVDASLTEQWRASNLFGPQSRDSCYGAVSLRALGGGDLLAPV